MTGTTGLRRGYDGADYIYIYIYSGYGEWDCNDEAEEGRRFRGMWRAEAAESAGRSRVLLVILIANAWLLLLLSLS
jgi:hypothetical protein